MNCPICAKPTLDEMKPFCSRRCADIDLSRWLNEAYAIPSSDLDDATEPEVARDDTVRKPSEFRH